MSNTKKWVNINKYFDDEVDWWSESRNSQRRRCNYEKKWTWPFSWPAPKTYCSPHLVSLSATHRSKKAGKISALIRSTRYHLMTIRFVIARTGFFYLRLFVLYLCVLYSAHITVSWRFTILLLGDIGHQFEKASLVAALSPHLILLTNPIHAWNGRWNQR